MVGHWIAFALIIPLIPFSLVFSFVKFGKLNEQNEKEKQRIYAAIVKTTLYFWLLDLFYMSCFTNWTFGKYLFGISTILLVFVNLTSAFLAKSKGNKWTLLLDFLVGIGLSTYLIYIITDATLQTVVLAIVAAVYGGLLTLVGVAWTIKDSNEKRAEDLFRVENERKEEERKKNIPYVRLDFEKELPKLLTNARMVHSLDFEYPEELSKLNKKVFYQILIKDFVIKNISKTNIILNGVFAYGNYHKFSNIRIIEPGERCTIRTTYNTMLNVAQLERSMDLITSDALGNKYKTECHLDMDSRGDRFRMVTTIDGEEYTGFEYPQIVSSVELPVLLNNENQENN